jgi:hypothetical protein
MPAAGTSVDGLWWTRCVFNEVVARSRENPDLRGPALLLLRTAAEGRAEEISDEILKPFRIPRDFIETGAMNDLDGRVLAFDAIGRLASSEARGYLDSIDPKQFREEDQGRLSIVIRQARLELRLDEHADPQRRAEFLVGILRARRADPYTAMPTIWAAEELCRMGAMPFLSEVELALREGMPSPQKEEKVQFCREEMRLVSSKPDRTEALASALRGRETLENSPLVTGVITELGEARTEASWKALEQFVNDAEKTYGTMLHESPVHRHVQYAQMFLKSRF